MSKELQLSNWLRTKEHISWTVAFALIRWRIELILIWRQCWTTGVVNMLRLCLIIGLTEITSLHLASETNQTNTKRLDHYFIRLVYFNRSRISLLIESTRICSPTMRVSDASLWNKYYCAVRLFREPMMMMSWCLMSSDVSWHIRDKLWPMPKHGSVILYVHGNQKAR